MDGALLSAAANGDGVRRAMIDVLPLPVVVHDQRAQVGHANQNFADLLGYPPAHVLTMSAGDTIHHDDH